MTLYIFGFPRVGQRDSMALRLILEPVTAHSKNCWMWHIPSVWLTGNVSYRRVPILLPPVTLPFMTM